MKRYLFFFLTAVFLIAAAPTQAQTPGIVGKKFGVFYAPNLIWNLFSVNVNGNGGWNAFSVKHQASIEYIVSRRISLGAVYSYTPTGISASLDSIRNGYINTTYFTARGDFHTFGIEAKFSKKSKNRLSGIGPFFGFGVQYMLGIARDPNNVITIEEGKQGKLAQRGWFAFTFNFGYQKVFFHRLAIRMGMQLQLNPYNFNPLTALYEGISFENHIKVSKLADKTYRINEEDARAAVYHRMNLQHFMSFYLGIGVYIF